MTRVLKAWRAHASRVREIDEWPRATAKRLCTSFVGFARDDGDGGDGFIGRIIEGVSCWSVDQDG